MTDARIISAGSAHDKVVRTCATSLSFPFFWNDPHDHSRFNVLSSPTVK